MNMLSRNSAKLGCGDWMQSNDYVRRAGIVQIVSTTIDLDQAADSYNLFTGAVADCVLQSLVIRLPNVDCSDDTDHGFTDISIHTDDVTQSVIISSVVGAIGNLTAEAQLAWVGNIFIKVGTKIQLTIAGGAVDDATVCDVVATFVADSNGGYFS